MFHRKIPRPHYEHTGTPSPSPPGAAEDVGAAEGRSSTIANYFDREMFHRKILRPHYEQTGTPSSSTPPAGAAEDVGAAEGRSSTIANYFDREMFHRKILRPHYEQTGTPSSSTPPAGAAEDVGAAGGTSSTIANYFDRLKFEEKIIQKGGSEKIFLEKFQARAGEKLLKASHCFLSSETDAVAGLLFISTEKIAFCSQRSITLDFPNSQHIQTVDQFEIPPRSIRASNFGDPHQKIIRIRTEDNSEFLFIDFLRYEKARQNFETAMRQL